MGFAGVEYAAAALLARHPYTVTLPLSLLALLGLAVLLLAAGGAVFVVRHYRHPVVRLAAAIAEARDGELALAAFPLDVGGLKPLVAPIQGLLHDIRRRRAEINQMHAEVHRRVERQTDALQRTVGQLKAQATRDGLTGLFNRRMLDQCLEDVVARCAADGAGLCLMMIDLDDFKLLNDTLGHAAGDALLRSVGQLIRSSVREQDLPFRCGGDEFLILLPESGIADGESLARRLGELVDALVKTLPLTRRPRLSIGLSTLKTSGPTATGKTLMEDADRRLYLHKTQRKGKPPSAGRAA
jgi:diguanylate cyclase (GGDEF)-like protein